MACLMSYLKGALHQFYTVYSSGGVLSACEQLYYSYIIVVFERGGLELVRVMLLSCIMVIVGTSILRASRTKSNNILASATQILNSFSNLFLTTVMKCNTKSLEYPFKAGHINE